MLGVLSQVEFRSINEWSLRICYHGGLARSKVIGNQLKVAEYCLSLRVTESLTVPSRTKRPEAEVTGLRTEESKLARRLVHYSLTHRAVMAVRGARIACSRLPARPVCVPGLTNPDTGLPDCDRGLDGQGEMRYGHPMGGTLLFCEWEMEVLLWNGWMKFGAFKITMMFLSWLEIYRS